MISIVIPLFNKEKYIVETINSVLNQTFKDFELIIVNDGSIDNSLDIVQSFIDNRIKIISIENGGVSNARNVGIKHAQYEWIAFLDGDDYWAPQYLSEAFNKIYNDPTIQVIATNYYKVYKDRKIKGLNISTGFINSYFETPCINSSAVIINKEILNFTGFFLEKLKYGEDQHLWFRLANYTNIFFQSIPMVYYRMDDHQISNTDFSNRDINSDLVSVINDLDINHDDWRSFKEEYLLKCLKPYYICDNHYKTVNSLIKSITINRTNFFLMSFYSLPRFIIKPLYKVYFLKKYT